MLCTADAGTPKAGSPRASRSGTPRAHVEDARIWREIFRFLRNPRKPVILAMSRPDAKKNITTLVKAYGSNAALREIANLVLIMVSSQSECVPLCYSTLLFV